MTFFRPVTGIRASDLTVNGLPATQVAGSGAGRYSFTGYPPPTLGLVKIALAPGQIKDAEYGTPFEGWSYTFRLFDPAVDEDGDGLTNDTELQVFSDPTKTDTDSDGLPDVYEVAHHCLTVFMNEALPRNDYGVVRPGDDDADDDGVSNLEEFRRGTDPCAP